MKVLFVHNEYQQRSGEAFVYDLDREAARLAGHEVVEYVRDNAELNGYGPLQKLSLAARTVWAWDTQRALAALLEQQRPELAHFVNTLPLVSPAAFVTCRQRGIPVLYNVQNYRLACPAATFLRDGRICTECSDHGLHRSVLHACYRDSRAATLAVAASVAVHRMLGTYRDAIDTYMVPSAFMAQTLAERAGIDARKIVIKANSVDPDPGARATAGSYLLFAGRFTPEKGILTLLDAYAQLDTEVPLRLVGAGPLLSDVRSRLSDPRLRNVSLAGSLSHADAIAQIKGALALILPSEWFEGVPLSLLEAFACGVPAIAGRIGSVAEVVAESESGMLFEPGDAADLARVLRQALADRAGLDAMGTRGRARYLSRHTLEKNAEALDALYRALV